MQVDGEPCRLAPAMIRISLRNQANMVQKSKRRTSMPLLNEWVCPCPPWWPWRPWRGGHCACAWSGASLCWERRRVQETQQLLGLSHIFLLRVYYTVTTPFFQKLLLYDVLEWWCFSTDHLSIHLLGPAENHWVIQGRKTCPVERVLFCLRRRAVGLLFSLVTWRVGFSRCRRSAELALAPLSPHCIPFCPFPMLPFWGPVYSDASTQFCHPGWHPIV